MAAVFRTLAATIGQDNHSTDSVCINVSFGQAECVERAPSMGLLPANQMTDETGIALNYNLSVTSTDGSGCLGTASYTLTADNRSDMSGFITPSVLKLGPSQLATAVLTVNVSGSDGAHTSSVTATHDNAGLSSGDSGA